MAKTERPGNATIYRPRLLEHLDAFEAHRRSGALRGQALELAAMTRLLWNLGGTLLPDPGLKSAEARILAYLKRHVGVVLAGDELMAVAGISEYARRIRELRVQGGWKILSGMTLQNMEPEELEELFGGETPRLRPDQYILLSDEEDVEAAQRWRAANTIRKDKNLSARNKILKYLRAFVGKDLSGEELRYVAGNKTEWARRTRELRTEHGWPVLTRLTGRPDLPVGVYVLEEDRQGPEHDRKIPDPVYRAVLLRDNHTCQDCDWTHAQWSRSLPRHLELHHITEHAAGGANTAENLITLCNACHDERHRPSGHP